MKPRISKKLSWPHPTVKPFETYSNYSNNYTEQLPPPAFQPFESSPESSHKPCPHIFRSSAYVLGKTPELNSNLELGCIISPFSACSMHALPQLSIGEVRRCESCNTILNQSWICYSKDKVMCGMCQDYMDTGSQHSIRGNGNQGVRQIIFQKQQKFVRRILFVLEASSLVWNSEIYGHLVHNVEMLSEDNVEYKVEVGFIIYGQFIKIIAKAQDGFQVINIRDCQQTQFPVPMSSVFHQVDQKLKEVYDSLQQLLYPDQNTSLRMRFNCHSLLRMVVSQIEPSTEVILITSDHKLTTVGTDPKAQANLSNNVNLLADKFLTKNVAISLFSVSKDKKPLHLFQNLLERTGGTCCLYTLNRQFRPQDFYYDLYHYFHQKHYFNIQIKVHTSRGLKCTQINHRVIQKGQQQFQLSKMNEFSNFSIFLETTSQIQRALISIEIKYKHRQRTQIKVINHQYQVSNKLSDIYSALGDQSLFYLILRKAVYSQSSLKPPSPLFKVLTARFKSIIKQCSSIWMSTASFTIPNCLKYSVFYLQTVVRVLQSDKHKHTSDYILNQSSYYWKHTSLERLSKKISMKLYRVDCQEPVNLKYVYYNIQEGGIYAIDNGEHIYIYVGDNVSPAIVEDYLTISSSHVEITSTNLSNFIQKLRAHNTSRYLQPRLISQQNRQILLDGLYMEDPFKKFIKLLSQ